VHPGARNHGQQNRQADGDGHQDDDADRQEPTVQQRGNRDAGLQPLQHLDGGGQDLLHGRAGSPP
jgi:hypothetical protein